MREPRPIQGARVPLFERFFAEEPGSRRPARLILDSDSLRESIRTELSRMLNTRSSYPGSLTEYTEGTVLDYGIPNFSHLSAASESHQREIAAIISDKISIHEPRLTSVQVVTKPSAADPRRMIGMISAEMRVGVVTEPVTFSLDITQNSNRPEVPATVQID